MTNPAPEGELPILLIDMDDMATEDDLKAHRTAMAEYASGETTAHDAINWD